MKNPVLYSFLAAGALACLYPRPAFALPAMIRLGYPNCASCHITPQGGGLLNLYGRGIDRAQSWIGGEYQPSQNPFIQDLNWGGRITQDIRVVMQQQDTSTTDKAGTQFFRTRFIYRNATEFGGGFRFTATVTGENYAVPRPSLVYDSPVKPAELFANTALLSYRPRQTLEIAVGRDQLPTGINLPDLSFFIRSRNRSGYYDTPTQAKLFWWGKRYLITPYAFAPGGNERAGNHESGGGALAEFDVFGKQKTILGANFLHGVSLNGNRTLFGPYARFGFGKWGFLAEHDITGRALKTGTAVSFQQNASYGQLFWAAKEWLVPSLIVERLQVSRPYRERLDAMRLDFAARLTSQVTISAGPRLQRDELTGRLSRSVVFQVAIKTVH